MSDQPTIPIAQTVRQTVSQIIYQIYSANSGGPDTGTMAALRRAQNINDHYASKLYSYLFNKLPAKPPYLSSHGKPTAVEKAIFTALHLWVLDQQGNDHLTYQPHHYQDPQSGKQLMTVLGELRNDPKLTKALDRRLQVVLTANNFAVVVNSLSHLILIAKGQNRGQKIDFADLAVNLYHYQLRQYHGDHQTTLTWGEQYFSVHPQNSTTSNMTTAEVPDN